MFSKIIRIFFNPGTNVICSVQKTKDIFLSNEKGLTWAKVFYIPCFNNIEYDLHRAN